MKKFLPAITALLLLASCKSSKDYLAHSNEDKTLYSIIKQLNKKPTDERAIAALPQVYAQLQQTHLAAIERHKNSTHTNRWDKLNSEYRILQEMHDAIINSAAAKNVVAAVNYQPQLDSIREMAANEQYQLAQEYYHRHHWKDYRNAYTAFKKSESWINNYKDSKAMMDSAKKNGTVNIVINPVEDNSFFYNSGWSSNGFEITAANFPQNLASDLGGKNAGRYPARLYTQWLAQREEINADWQVDLTVKNIDIPSPTIYNYTRKRTAKVEDGKDTSGRTLYKTVSATLYIQRRSFDASAQIDLQVTDAVSKESILYDSFTDRYNWQQEAASYNGDSRALQQRDWELINNRYYQPVNQEIISQLYRGLYPQVKNRIGGLINW